MRNRRVLTLSYSFLSQKSQEIKEMKKEKSPVSSIDKKKELVSKLSRLSIDNNVFEGSTDLPQVFQVYLSIFILYLCRGTSLDRLGEANFRCSPRK